MSKESDEADRMAQAEVAFKSAQLAIAKAKAEGATTLILSDYALDKIPVEIGTLNTLTDLQLMYTQVRDLSPISALSSLSKLSVVSAPIEDIGPIEKLTNLVYLDLHLTHAKDITPLHNLSKLEVIDLAYIGIGDVAALSKLTRLRQINMKNNSVLDFRPFRNIVIPESASERPDDFWGFVQCLNECIIDFDPQFSDMLDRGLAGFRNAIAYLNGLDDADYDRRLAKWRAAGENASTVTPPDQEPLLRVSVIDDKFDVEPALASAEEQADPVKQKALERLRDAVEVLRRSGNRHADIDAVSRSLAAAISKPLDQVDLLDVHFELEACRGIYQRRDERSGDEELGPETISALERVGLVGPGLTLDNEMVERLEERRRRYSGPPTGAVVFDAHDEISRSIVETPNLFGAHLRAYSAHFLKDGPDPTSRARVGQDAANRNTLIWLGLYVAGGMMSGPLGDMGSEILIWLTTHQGTIKLLAGGWGESFAAWMAPVLGEACRLHDAANHLINRRTGKR